MTILSTGNKGLYIKQGDTGNVAFRGIPTDKNYNVFLSIYNPETNAILSEIQLVFTQSTGVALLQINETESNALPVGDWEYGLKICYGGSEDTVLPRAYIDDGGNLVRESAPAFIVDNKYVEGD